jgi:hypothetical protein
MTIEQQMKQRRDEFNELFQQEYKPGVNMISAYEDAEIRFMEKYQARAYSNFQSFSSARFNRTKRKLTKK